MKHIQAARIWPRRAYRSATSWQCWLFTGIAMYLLIIPILTNLDIVLMGLAILTLALSPWFALAFLTYLGHKVVEVLTAD